MCSCNVHLLAGVWTEHRSHVNFLCRCTAWRNSLLRYFKIPRRAEKWAESQIVPSPAPLRHGNGGTYLTATRYWCNFSAFEMFANILTFAACLPWSQCLHPLTLCSKNLMQQNTEAHENLPKFFGETQRTRYTEAGTYLYQLAVCHVVYQRQWVCALLRTRFFGIFWRINKRVVTRAIVCTAAALSSLCHCARVRKKTIGLDHVCLSTVKMYVIFRLGRFYKKLSRKLRFGCSLRLDLLKLRWIFPGLRNDSENELEKIKIRISCRNCLSP